MLPMLAAAAGSWKHFPIPARPFRFTQLHCTVYLASLYHLRVEPGINFVEIVDTDSCEDGGELEIER